MKCIQERLRLACTSLQFDQSSSGALWLAKAPKASSWGQPNTDQPSKDFDVHWSHLNHCMTKPTKWHVCPAKTMYGLRVAKDPNFLQADNEDSNQTGRTPD